MEYGLAELWQSWGIEPAAVIGHSVGEYVAACVAGVFTLEDGLRLVAERGRLMQALPPGGAMAAIFAPEDAVAPHVALRGEAVAVAAVNGAANTVVSGTIRAVEEIAAMFRERGTRVQRLSVSHAFHSPLMEPMLDAFERAASRVFWSAPRLRLISGVTGSLADAAVVTTASYWREHARVGVRFADGVRTLATLRPDVCLEVGPHPVLLSFAQEVMSDGRVAFAASARTSVPSYDQLAEALGTLFLAGAPTDWRAVWRPHGARLVDLPTYPFERERVWFKAPRAAAATGRDTGHPLLGTRLRTPLPDIVQFETVLRAADVPYLRDHHVGRRTILPGAAYVEMALAAARLVLERATSIEGLVMATPMEVGEEQSRRVQTVLRLRDDAPPTFEIMSTDADIGDDDWRLHARGSLAPATTLAPPVPDTPATGREGIDATKHQARLAARGLLFGPSLNGVRQVERGDGVAGGTAVGVVSPPPDPDHDVSPYLIPPALLDGCLQLLEWAIPQGAARDVAYLPLMIERVQRYRTPGASVRCWAYVDEPAARPADTLVGRIVIADEAGVVATLDGVTLRATETERASAANAAVGAKDLYTVAWERLQDDESWTPTAAALAAAVGPELDALAVEHDFASYFRAATALESLASRWIVRALRRLGWDPRRGDPVRVADLGATLGVPSRYHRLLHRLLGILHEVGALQRNGDGWVVQELPPDDVSPALSAQAHFDASPARFDVARRCGDALDRVLLGAVDPLELLFPGGSSAEAESLYRDTPEAKGFNQLVREAVRALQAQMPAARTLNVLEVGGGTGGTTAWVAPVLDAERTHYLFTDVGRLLVERARERFSGARPYMQFALFDLEQDPAAQAPGGRRYDLILASNVVHATADLRRTLRHLRSLLAPGGMLLILEVAGRERWIDLTFGLTNGWWRFTDTELRRDYPLLSRESWVALLASEGFEVAEIGAPHPHSQQLLLAARAPSEPAAGAAFAAGAGWLVFADDGGVGDALAARLAQHGLEVHVLHRHSAPDGHAEVGRMVAEHGATATGIVHLWSLDVEPLDVAPPDVASADEAGTPSLLPGQEMSLGSLVQVVQALGRLSLAAGAAPRLWIGTRGAIAVGHAAPVAMAQSAVWGLGRGIAKEYPELRPTSIDLDPAAASDVSADALLACFALPAEEDQCAIREGVRLVPRLESMSAAPPPPPAGVLERLEASGTGVLDDLSVVQRARKSPGPRQVEIEVHAAGLNFHDVLSAVAMLADEEPLGGECAGHVAAIGERVTEFAVGDAVVAVAEAAFGTYAVADIGHVAPLPAGIGYAEAATLPFAFMTARHALRSCAKLGRGEIVLIHAAAGGVGLAAVQIAQAAGATIIATAGSDAKRRYLRRLGVGHVFDSRSTAFAGEVHGVTRGRGADVILNSLAGEFIAASVSCLSATGRFLEIGRRDIWTDAQFRAARPAGTYFAIDLAQVRRETPALSHVLFRDTIADASRGAIRPLALRAFPLHEATAAFRFMAQARHIGKIVLLPEAATRGALDRLLPGATYLVTGGLSGLGLVTATQLVARGARHLMLVARRAPSAAATRAIDAMRTRGADVRVTSADMGLPTEVARVLREVQATMPPLAGVVHSAGALDDGALQRLSWERFMTPLRTKLDGAWALHALTRHRTLDFFILYSSAASVLGSAGQGSHCAANAFMDALAFHRRSEGLPALSVSWGAWSEIGAAADRRVDQAIASKGIGAITPSDGLALLDAATRADAPHVLALPVHWAQLRAQQHPVNGRRLLDRVARRETAAVPTRSAGPAGPSTAPRGAATLDLDGLRDAAPARRRAAMIDFVAGHVSRVLNAPSAQAIDVHQPLDELGLDSLMAVELRNRLGRGLALDRTLPATLAFDHPTLDSMASFLLEVVPGASVATPASPPAATPITRAVDAVDAVDAIAGLTDEQIDARFADRARGS